MKHKSELSLEEIHGIENGYSDELPLIVKLPDEREQQRRRWLQEEFGGDLGKD